MKAIDVREKWQWKQDTPAMQLTSITQSLWGHASNAQDCLDAETAEAIDLPLFVNRMSAHAVQLLDLLPFIQKGSWNDPTCEVCKGKASYLCLSCGK